MKLHHVGIVVNDIESGIQRYKALFGFVPVTEIVDDPIQKVSVVLLSNPESDGAPIELIAPLSDDSPVTNILKGKVRLYHLCFLVENIEESLKNFRSNGAIIISGPVPAELFEGKRIAFVYSPDNYVVELLEK
ncbi:MAG: methylmalonyl-CoA epimerase [Candidatus Bathyarchaeum sp.]|nr:MAG: methylmalonyl-CoA epimerase [Candidatus Bathyarchaeum sp.]